MNDQQVIPLNERLRIAAESWCEATGRSLGALSSLVTNQGSFFERLGSTRNGTSTLTLDKFARFLVDPANWPAPCAVEGETADSLPFLEGQGPIPEAALAFCHAVGISAPQAAQSPDTGPGIIGNPAPRAMSNPSDRGAGSSSGADEIPSHATPSAPGDMLASEVRA